MSLSLAFTIFSTFASTAYAQSAQPIEGQHPLGQDSQGTLTDNNQPARRDDIDADAEQLQHLPMINVKGVSEISTVTEGSNSYTSPRLTVGSKIPQSIRQTPQSVSVITQQRLQDQNLTNLDAALGQSTGITVNNTSNRSSSLFARGFLVTNVQIDGVPLALPTNNYGFDTPDLAIYDHVEVLRGSAGLLNGAGTPGAVIGLTRKRPTLENQFNVNTTYGSWNNMRVEIDGSALLNADGSLRARGVVVQEDRDFFYDIAEQKKTLMYGVIEYDFSNQTRFTFGASHQDLTGVPMNGTNMPRYNDGANLKLPRSTFLGAAWNREEAENTELFGEMEHRFGSDWKLKTGATRTLSETDSKIGFLLGAIDPVTKSGSFQRGNAVKAEVERQGLDAVLSGSFEALGQRHEVVLGMNRSEHRYQSDIVSLYPAPYRPVDIFNYDPRAVPEPITPASTNGANEQNTIQTGVYGTLRLKIADPVSLILGARDSHWKFKQQNLMTNRVVSNYSDQAITPFAGLVVDLNKTWSAYASYADVFQVQNSFMFNGQRLEPITGVNYEVGLKGELFNNLLNTSFAIFHIDRKNVAQRDTINTSPTACNGLACYVAGGETQSQGFEAEVSGALTQNWNLFAGYTFNTTKYVRDRTITGAPSINEGEPLTAWVPEHIFRLWTTYQLPGELNKWSIGGGVNAQTSFYRVLNGNRMEQGGYALWNARAAYRIDENWTVAATLNNVFDKTYYSRFNLLDQGNMYGEPRNFMLSLRGKF